MVMKICTFLLMNVWKNDRTAFVAAPKSPINSPYAPMMSIFCMWLRGGTTGVLVVRQRIFILDVPFSLHTTERQKSHVTTALVVNNLVVYITFKTPAEYHL